MYSILHWRVFLNNIRIVRPAKVEWMNSFCGSKIEIIAVEDLATANLKEALKSNRQSIIEKFSS